MSIFNGHTPDLYIEDEYLVALRCIESTPEPLRQEIRDLIDLLTISMYPPAFLEKEKP